MFHIVVAIDQNRGIGKNGVIPWNLHADMRYFAHLTSTTRDPKKQNAVIIGRATWKSLPERFRPLLGRLNIVLTRTLEYTVPNGVLLASSLDEAFSLAHENSAERIFVIGGGSVYAKAINHAQCESLYVTQLHEVFACDTFFPSIDQQRFDRIELSEVKEENGIQFQFLHYVRKR